MQRELRHAAHRAAEHAEQFLDAEMVDQHLLRPHHVLLVLDAAYAEYVRRNDYEAGIELVGSAENVVMSSAAWRITRPG